MKIKIIGLLFMIIGAILVYLNINNFMNKSTVNSKELSSYLEKKYNKKFKDVTYYDTYYIDIYGNHSKDLDTSLETHYITNYIYTAKDENNIKFYVKKVYVKGNKDDFIFSFTDNGYYDNYVNEVLNDTLLLKIKYDYTLPFNTSVSIVSPNDYDYPLIDTSKLLSKENLNMKPSDYLNIFNLNNYALMYRVEEGMNYSNVVKSISTIRNYIIEINATGFNPNIIIVYSDNNYLYYDSHPFIFDIGNNYFDKDNNKVLVSVCFGNNSSDKECVPFEIFAGSKKYQEIF